MTNNTSMFSDAFVTARKFSDMDEMWNIVQKIIILSADRTFKKKWFKSFNSVFNKISSRFHKLELLVSKLVRNSHLVSGGDFASLLKTWNKLDSSGVSVVRSLFLSGSGFDLIRSALAKIRKLYHASKLLESKCAEEFSIKQTISKRMESFELDKVYTIRSVLKRPFRKVVLNHLVVEDELVLEPDFVKLKVNKIMEGWTRKHRVVSDISEDWVHQYRPLKHVFDDAFSGVMCPISFDEMLVVIKDLLNGKVTGLSGISNKLWKCCNKSVLDMLLVLLNLCLVNPQAGLSLFLAASAFVDDTIWVGSSQTATQCILDVASKFFRFNNISVNNDKIVAIPINCRVLDPHLTISGVPISIAKKRKSHCYLGIFLSSKGFSKPSLAKAQMDVRFFVNLVLRKTVSDKQYVYLVSAVFFSIISYRTQFSFISDALVCKILKSKSGLSHDFPNNTLYHPSLYGLKTFEQIQAESKLAFACVSSLRCYGIAFVEQFCGRDGDVFSWETFKHWKKLDPYGPIPFWFDLSVHFLGGIVPLSSSSSLVDNYVVSNIHLSHDFGVVCDTLLTVDAAHFSVYMDGSLSSLSTFDIKVGAAIFFEDINLGLGVGVFGLVSSTMTELQAIALALECVSSSCLIDLFSNSQATLDAYGSESSLIHLDFRNCCWIKHHHIATVICQKNLDVNWVKVKSYSGVLGNEHADALAKDAALSAWCLSHLVSECFLYAGGMAVSGNSRHFVHNVFQSVNRAHWKVGVGSRIVADSLHADINWFKFSLVWHTDFHLAFGFTNMRMASCRTYFMKALYYWLSVAMHKQLYNRRYSSVVCLFCGDVEISDHVFSCPQDAASHARLLNTHALAWEALSGLSRSFSCVLQVLASCISEVEIGVALYKGFVFND
ncbi:hypothetical protein G9A89_004563 [Geosiphon pyriformis]|nr:hypothetical protein G9A89_004563 [Geosiphon pyriformis]